MLHWFCIANHTIWLWIKTNIKAWSNVHGSGGLCHNTLLATRLLPGAFIRIQEIHQFCFANTVLTSASESLHSGHILLWSSERYKHSLQKVWPHGVVTGLYNNLKETKWRSIKSSSRLSYRILQTNLNLWNLSWIFPVIWCLMDAPSNVGHREKRHVNSALCYEGILSLLVEMHAGSCG